jgi:uncharacterized membrane protein
MQWRRWLAPLAGASFFLYPVTIYLGARWVSPRTLAIGLACLWIPLTLVRRPRATAEAGPGIRVALPVVVGLFLGLTIVLNSTWFLLRLPAVASLGFLFVFGRTLLKGPPMVERFARLIDPDLTPAEVDWCRLWTGIWCVFFAVNGLVSLLLSSGGLVGPWASHNGIVSYTLMGGLFGTEYVCRKFRFGRLRDHFLDRQLGRAFLWVRRR